MKPEKYTVVVIPDDESGTKSYNISRTMIRILSTLGILFVLGIVVIFIIYGPKISEYNIIKGNYENLAAERLKVLELSRDLQRLKQMDEFVRKSLGAELDFDEKPILVDTVTGMTINPDQRISYVENIPSVAPIKGFVSQRSGRMSPFIRNTHRGIDIVSKEGEPILSAAAGVVMFSGWTYEMGNLIIIYHGDGYFTHYGHNQRNLKLQLDLVSRGEVIGMVGSTGISSGPHLHFEVWKDEKSVDPLIYFPEYKLTDLTSNNG